MPQDNIIVHQSISQKSVISVAFSYQSMKVEMFKVSAFLAGFSKKEVLKGCERNDAASELLISCLPVKRQCQDGRRMVCCLSHQSLACLTLK